MLVSRQEDATIEDLQHFEAPREVGLTAQEALALWPHQFFEKATDCRRLLACEALDVFQRNLNANFSLLTRLAGARTPLFQIDPYAPGLLNHLQAGES
jgi:hypothetical protein